MSVGIAAPAAVSVRHIGPEERDYWDAHIETIANAHPFNAYDWGVVRETDGWTPVHIAAERDGIFCGGMLLLMKRLPFLPYSIFCSPHGPVCRVDDREAIEAVHAAVRELARKHRAILLRIDPNVHEEASGPLERILTGLGYTHLEQRWTFWNSPRDEYRIPLASAASVDELHNGLDRDTRRCIRKAGKEGLTIEIGTTEEDLQAFYSVFSDYSVTRGFMARGYEYQKRLWERYVARGRGRLFLAKYEGQVIGGLLCILYARKCVAMHMGTPYKYQKLQPNYAYVWEGIRWAKESGCEWFTFRGVGTTPTQEAFKRKFNPRVVPLAGYFDHPFRPTLYTLFYFAEFTALPAIWPLLVKGRRVLSDARKRLGGRSAQ